MNFEEFMNIIYLLKLLYEVEPDIFRETVNLGDLHFASDDGYYYDSIYETALGVFRSSSSSLFRLIFKLAPPFHDSDRKPSGVRILNTILFTDVLELLEEFYDSFMRQLAFNENMKSVLRSAAPLPSATASRKYSSMSGSEKTVMLMPLRS